MNYQFLLFEAKSIQAYLMETNKVKQLTGASEIVDNLMEGFLDSVLKKYNLNEDDDIHFIRRAGGAFYAWTKTPGNIQAFIELWPLLVSQYAPGLPFIWTVHDYDGTSFKDGLEKAFKAHHINNSVQSSVPLPQFTSIMLRDPRTGRAAIRTQDEDLQDAASVRRHERGTRSQTEEGTQRLTSLEMKITPSAKTNLTWSADLRGQRDNENTNIAVIHIDGNGFGQLIIDLREIMAELSDIEYSRLFQKFSKSIQQSTTDAIKAVLEEMLGNTGDTDDKTIRVRPIVIGGDDVTLITAAENAVDISENFILKFEENTSEALKTFKKELKGKLKAQSSENGNQQEQLDQAIELEVTKIIKESPQRYKEGGQITNLTKKIRKVFRNELKQSSIADKALLDKKLAQLPSKLTACGAIVYIKYKQPFYKAYQTCESLCTDVKRQMKSTIGSKKDGSKGYYSALGLHRITDSFLSDFNELNQLQNHLNTNKKAYCLSLGAYAIDDNESLPSLKKLKTLADFVRDHETDCSQLLRLNAGETPEGYEHRKGAFERRQNRLPHRAVHLASFSEKLNALYNNEETNNVEVWHCFIKDGDVLKSPIREIEALLAVSNHKEKQ